MDLKLPNVVMTRSDLLRLTRELEALDHFLNGQDITQEEAALPRTSKSLDAFLRENNMNVKDAIVRKTILEFLSFLKTSAPVVHMSFAKDPPANALAKLVNWFRVEVNPITLVDIGVQPNIAGGCMLRSGSKIFDFSLRKHLTTKKDLLRTSIAASVGRDIIARAEGQTA